MKALTLLSGGLDSTIATHMARERYEIVLALTFDYGQRAATREIDAAQSLCRELKIEHRIVKLPWLEEITNTALVDRTEALPEVDPHALEHDAYQHAAAVWVPNRNSVFLSIAASYAESFDLKVIIAGFNAEEAETFSDNSAPFVDAANDLLALSTQHDVKVESPTLSMTKADIVRELLSLDIDPNAFWCCYEGNEKLCGKCESCARTIRAFEEAGAFDNIRSRFA